MASTQLRTSAILPTTTITIIPLRDRPPSLARENGQGAHNQQVLQPRVQILHHVNLAPFLPIAHAPAPQVGHDPPGIVYAAIHRLVTRLLHLPAKSLPLLRVVAAGAAAETDRGVEFVVAPLQPEMLAAHLRPFER